MSEGCHINDEMQILLYNITKCLKKKTPITLFCRMCMKCIFPPSKENQPPTLINSIFLRHKCFQLLSVITKEDGLKKNKPIKYTTMRNIRLTNIFEVFPNNLFKFNLLT